MQCNVRMLKVTVADWAADREEKSAVIPLCVLTLLDGDLRGGVGEKTRYFSVTIGSITLDDTSTPHTAYTRILGPTQGTFTSSLQTGTQPLISVEVMHNPPGR